MVSSLATGLILLSHIFTITFSAYHRGSVCRANEFYCESDKKCIDESKVCDFFKDCQDGSDEAKCGECDFSRPPADCGLELVPDKAFAWRVETVPILVHLSHRTHPQHHLITDLIPEMRSYAAGIELRPDAVFRPKVRLPHLRRTNEQCVFSFRYYISSHPPNTDFRPILMPTTPRIVARVTVDRMNANKSLTSSSTTYDPTTSLVRGSWTTATIPLRNTSMAHRWSLEIYAEMRVDSYLVQLSDFKFVDCQPIDYTPDDQNNSISEVPCRPDQFRCEISRLCIDTSLICDFGYDCGDEDDTSDEDQCDSFPGRCDFEDQSLCGWFSSPNVELWTRYSALDEDQKFYGDRARPLVDHTFRSAQKGGNYIMLNMDQMGKSDRYKLIGPRVELVPGTSRCTMRLWVYTPESVDQLGLSSAILTIGNQKISSDRLLRWPKKLSTPGPDVLSGRSDNKGWRRFEIDVLLEHLNSHIYSLDIIFGNLQNELDAFKSHRGFVALDDFSFSPGCKLIFNGEPPKSACHESEFFCLLPTPKTMVSCIPGQYYCDFKNDCGKVYSKALYTADEEDCPNVCKFNETSDEDGLKHCKLDILDSQTLKSRGILALDEEQLLTDPFKWQLANPARGFMSIRVDPPSMIRTIEDARLNGVDPKQAYSLTNLDMKLPRYSVAHANCTFEMVYRWDPKSVGISGSIVLEQASGESLIREIPARDTGSSWQSLTVGLCQQLNPFNLIIRTKIDELEGVVASGSLMIESYQFVGCAFFQGLVNPGNQVTFESYDDDDEYEPHDAYLDYPLGPKDSNKTQESCGPNHIQCGEPILCLPKNLVCDLQLDCQNGRDESEQLCQDFRRYTFIDDQFWSDGWQVDVEDSWRLVSSHELPDARRKLNTGPPRDHSPAGGSEGKYLALSSSWFKAASDLSELRSPQFELVPGSKCRLVFHVYLWGADVQSLSVFLSRADLSQGRRQVGQIDHRVDAWQRVEIALEGDSTSGGANRFVLVFQGATSKTSAQDMLALDDVSFNRNCRWIVGDRVEIGEIERKGVQAGTFSVGIFLLALAILVLGASGLMLVRSGLASRGLEWARAKRNQAAAAGFALDELEPVRKKGWFHSSTENLVEQQAHELD